MIITINQSLLGLQISLQSHPLLWKSVILMTSQINVLISYSEYIIQYNVFTI